MGLWSKYRQGRRGIKTRAGERTAVDCMLFGRKSEAVCEGRLSEVKVEQGVKCSVCSEFKSELCFLFHFCISSRSVSVKYHQETPYPETDKFEMLL
jgi:hypothetical protein